VLSFKLGYDVLVTKFRRFSSIAFFEIRVIMFRILIYLGRDPFGIPAISLAVTNCTVRSSVNEDPYLSVIEPGRHRHFL